MDLRTFAVAAVKLRFADTEPTTPRQDKTGPTRRISNIVAMSAAPELKWITG